MAWNVSCLTGLLGGWHGEGFNENKFQPHKYRHYGKSNFRRLSRDDHGRIAAVGALAPKFGGVRGDLSVLHLPDLLGKRVVINFFPSLDTPVCAASVRRFNKEAAALDNTVVLCVSKDLPFAQSRFCTTEGIENVIALSVFRCKCIDEKYGITIADGPLRGLLARAVVVVDTDGRIIYEQLVDEITNEPDYVAALAALK